MAAWGNIAGFRLKALLRRRKKDEPDENVVEQLLKPRRDLKFEDDSNSEISEISDVFEEFHMNSYLKPQSKHYLKKLEADIKTMEEFTQNFKYTMNILRGDLQVKFLLKLFIDLHNK